VRGRARSLHFTLIPNLTLDLSLEFFFAAQRYTTYIGRFNPQILMFSFHCASQACLTFQFLVHILTCSRRLELTIQIFLTLFSEFNLFFAKSHRELNTEILVFFSAVRATFQILTLLPTYSCAGLFGKLNAVFASNI
jgi:hypothetical protein